MRAFAFDVSECAALLWTRGMFPSSSLKIRTAMVVGFARLVRLWKNDDTPEGCCSEPTGLAAPAITPQMSWLEVATACLFKQPSGVI